MSAILITLEQPSPGELLWSLPTLSLQVKSASAASLQGLLRAFYDRPTLSASRALGIGLGELLFTGEFGELLREQLPDTNDPSQAGGISLCIQSEDSAPLMLPWELAYDPQQAELPPLAKRGVEILRLHGAAAQNFTGSGRTLIATGANEPYRLTALKAAARNLVTRKGMPCEELPRDLPERAQALEEGATLLHLDQLDRSGRLLDELDLRKVFWAILGGRFNESERALTALRGGLSLCLYFQFPLGPKESAALFRALYQALASGYPPVEACRWARRALLDDGEALAWAAPMLLCRPGGAQEPPPALLPFPPAAAPAASEGALTEAPAPAERAPISVRPLGLPVRAERFVDDTINLIQRTQRNEGSEEERIELTLRTIAMRQLSARVKGKGPEAKGEGRTAQLAAQLVHGSIYEAKRGGVPPRLEEEARAYAQHLGLHEGPVVALARALCLETPIWLWGGSAEQRALLLRGLAEHLFRRYPLELGPERGLISDQLQADAGATLSNGALTYGASLCWREQGTSLFDGSALPERAEMTLCAWSPARDEGWQVFEGLWLLIEDAERLPSGQLERALRALRQRSICGAEQESGRPLRLPIPPELRLILSSAHPPPQSQGLAVIQLVSESAGRVVERLESAAQAHGRWSSAHHELLRPVLELLELMERLAPLPFSESVELLRYLSLGGALETALDAGLMIYFADYSERLSPAGLRCLCAALQGDQEQLSALAAELFDGEQLQCPRLTLPNFEQRLTHLLGA